MKVTPTKQGGILIELEPDDIRKEEKETTKTLQTVFKSLQVKHDGKVKKLKVELSRKRTDIVDDTIPEL